LAPAATACTMPAAGMDIKLVPLAASKATAPGAMPMAKNDSPERTWRVGACAAMVAPNVSVVSPRGLTMHDAEPTAGDDVPGAHSCRPPLLGTNAPAGAGVEQKATDVAPVTAGAIVPAGHGVQALAWRPPLAKVFGGHSLHAVELSIENVPEGQFAQELRPPKPTEVLALNVPAGQTVHCALPASA
jgi:hypothetical protein